MSGAYPHIPVMTTEILAMLAPALQTPGSVFVDGTLGMGGHTEAILQACPEAHAIGIDRDPQAIAIAQQRLAPFGERFQAVHRTFEDIPAVLEELGVDSADAILYDLGVSSLQIDDPERGFAYSRENPLDMRMNPSAGGQTAADILATYSQSELTRIFREYGQERFAGKVARAIVQDREDTAFTTSSQLAGLLQRVIPASSQRSGGHPAKRTFQALRIEVNEELRLWSEAVTAAISALAPQGRIAVLSYHSLEDRITKSKFAAVCRSAAPLGLPVELPEHRAQFSHLGRASVPGPVEQARNSRAGSARLRGVQRISEGVS